MRTALLIFAVAVAAALGAAPVLAASLTPADTPQTQVADEAAFAKLVANTGVTLQWNWNTKPGTLTANARNGYLALTGHQQAKDGGSLDIDGVVTHIEARSFMFRGRIALHDAEANVDCVRDGAYTFRITGTRKYWRLKEQEAHCPGRADLTDYVDIYFK